MKAQQKIPQDPPYDEGPSWLDKPKYTHVKQQTDQNIIPKGSWEKCPNCDWQMMSKTLAAHLYICEHCDQHLAMPSDKRIELLSDEGSFSQKFQTIQSTDPLSFQAGSEPYKSKLIKTRAKLKINEGVITGTAKLADMPIALCVMEFRFIGGSMGSAVGERIFQLMKLAVRRKIPFISVSSSGGARMQEGLLSLMQMAKTSAGVQLLSSAGIPYISIMANPTMGGVTASFASLADFIIAEPGAMIGFAGRRVIDQTAAQELPENFQTAEFLQERGFIDLITPRTELKDMLIRILRMLRS